MHYKTIVLELLQAQPTLYRRLCLSRRLLQELDRHASDLKTAHQNWKDRLSRNNPEMDRRAVASAALEFAVEEMETRIAQEATSHDSAPA